MRRAAFWLALAVAGSALVIVAVLLSSASMNGPRVPSAQAQQTPGCELRVEKDGEFGVDIPFESLLTTTGSGQFDGGDEIEFTIAVTNVGEANCGSGSNEVVDELPEGLTCEDVGVVSDPTHTVLRANGCGVYSTATEGKGGQQVTFTLADLDPGEEVVLAIVARNDTDEDCVTNRACAEEIAGEDNALENGVCDQETVCRPRRHHTPTPTPKPTSTPAPTNTPLPPAPTATAKPLATVQPPATGTGSTGGGWSPLTLALAGAGGCLLVVSGGALAKKRIR
jgi:uncharacterized repeat protein (TIGR01451 family)